MCDPSGAGEAYHLVVLCRSTCANAILSSNSASLFPACMGHTKGRYGTLGHTGCTVDMKWPAIHLSKRIVPAAWARTNASAGTKPEREARKRVHTWSGPLDPSIRVKLGRMVNKLWVIACCKTAYLHLGLQCKQILFRSFS